MEFLIQQTLIMFGETVKVFLAGLIHFHLLTGIQCQNLNNHLIQKQCSTLLNFVLLLASTPEKSQLLSVVLMIYLRFCLC